MRRSTRKKTNKKKGEKEEEVQVEKKGERESSPKPKEGDSVTSTPISPSKYEEMKLKYEELLKLSETRPLLMESVNKVEAEFARKSEELILALKQEISAKNEEEAEREKEISRLKNALSVYKLLTSTDISQVGESEVFECRTQDALGKLALEFHLRLVEGEEGRLEKVEYQPIHYADYCAQSAYMREEIAFKKEMCPHFMREVLVRTTKIAKEKNKAQSQEKIGKENEESEKKEKSSPQKSPSRKSSPQKSPSQSKAASQKKSSQKAKQTKEEEHTKDEERTEDDNEGEENEDEDFQEEGKKKKRTTRRKSVASTTKRKKK